MPRRAVATATPGGLPWRVRREDAPEHRALKLRGQAVHEDLVVDLAAHHAALAAAADGLEACLLVGPEAYAVPEILDYHSVSRCYWQRTGRTTN